MIFYNNIKIIFLLLFKKKKITNQSNYIFFKNYNLNKRFKYVFFYLIFILFNFIKYNSFFFYKNFSAKNNLLTFKLKNKLVNTSKIKLINNNIIKFLCLSFYKNNFYFNYISLKQNRQKKICFRLQPRSFFLFNFFVLNYKKIFSSLKDSFLNKKIIIGNKSFFKKKFINNSKLIKIKNNQIFLVKNNFFNYKLKFIKTQLTQISLKNNHNFNLNYFLTYIIFVNDNFNLNKNNLNFLSNNILKNYFSFFDKNSINFKLKYNNITTKKYNNFNNFYPIFLTSKNSYKSFFNHYKNNYDIDYAVFTNKFVINFLEKNLKKYIYVKYINNYYNKMNNDYLNSILNDYKNFQPAFWKNFLVYDFINLLWYSYFLKDLNIISEWISIFMETLNFKNHKKFVNFFINFINKYSDVFINILGIKGFFFDIRGKVGVTGSSKKRHIFFKFGSLNKSSKNTKINFNQNLVRTYSGVLGLTYIINY